MQVTTTDCFNNNLERMELSLDEKYNLYRNSVYNPGKDEVIYLNRLFRNLKRKEPKVLREDFCGVFSMGVVWVNYSRSNKAICIDADSEPIEWGWKNPVMKLNNEKSNRIKTIVSDCRHADIENDSVDITIAGNWSQQILTKRDDLLAYFKNVYSSLNDNGILALTGVNSLHYTPEAYLESRLCGYKDAIYKYYFEIQQTCPFTHLGRCMIHYVKDNKLATPFVYPWRVWTIAEYLDVLSEAGFEKTTVMAHVEDEDNIPDGYKVGYHPTSLVEEDTDEMDLGVIAEKKITP